MATNHASTISRATSSFFALPWYLHHLGTSPQAIPITLRCNINILVTPHLDHLLVGRWEPSEVLEEQALEHLPLAHRRREVDVLVRVWCEGGAIMVRW